MRGDGCSRHGAWSWEVEEVKCRLIQVYGFGMCAVAEPLFFFGVCVCVSTPVPKGAYTQGAGVCFRCLQPMKTHLSHSDIVLGRQNYVPAFFNC